MNIICLDEAGCLFLSPRIEDWKYMEEHGITVVIDLEGEIDRDIPTMPNHILYLYFPIYDEDLPDLGQAPRRGADGRLAGRRPGTACSPTAAWGSTARPCSPG